ncbi:MAG TPA: hypothetical protein VF638_03985 [Sphingomonas sp.]|jgi:hypothetical protein
MTRDKRLAAAVAFAMIIVPGAASARSIYFHKTDVSRDTFAADALECESLAAGVEAPSAVQPYSSNIYAAGTAAFLSGFMKSRARRGMIENVLRTCMADRGYRRIEASDEEDKAISKVSGPARLERLAVLAAASEHQGKVLPR